MYAAMIEGKWWHYLSAAHASWGKPIGGRSSVVAAGRMQARMRSYAAHAWPRRIIPRMLGGLLITMAILAILYSVAVALVNGAVWHSSARTNHGTASQHAAAIYRHARAQCQRVPATRMDACIAEAHAEESRARVVASLPVPRGHIAALRSQTDAAIDAGDRDHIIIEPACNVVSRGQAGICEIQVKANSTSALTEADTKPPLMQGRPKVEADKNRQLVQSRANIQSGASRAVFQVRADSGAPRREIAFLSPGVTAAFP